jgi:acyl-homoserine lactone acylase PvdQ
MKRFFCVSLFFYFQLVLLYGQGFTPQEIARWEKQASQVTIIRDQWGIPHIYGKTDADAVFGLLYAQCEDDFKRIEMNYIEKLGRLAEVKGEGALYDDLLIRLVIDSADAIRDYKKAPASFKKLLHAFADGVNFYLYKNPEVQPTLLKRFEPWYPLLWTDGSIGAISTAGLRPSDLKAFYGETPAEGTGYYKPEEDPFAEEMLTGSNGFAFSPRITESGKAILYINPHVTFYFRPEVHMVSEEGLNAYGAVTWGQFFVYQGFNPFCGWMHTSSRADVSDAYLEEVVEKQGKWFYRYEQKDLPVKEKQISLSYTDQEGNRQEKKVKAFFTHHGPVMGQKDGKWVSVRSHNRSYPMLLQSWERTKVTSFEGFQRVMDRLENTSNNTVYADAAGNIAYWHGNFMPRRNPEFNWNEPVDGTIKATEWQGRHPVKETVHLYNPANGWLQNCNATPFTVAGAQSPKKADYPTYMAPDGENFRGINAVRILSLIPRYSLERTIAVGYDNYMAAFAVLVPALVKAFDKKMGSPVAPEEPMKEPIALLRNWDYYAHEHSVSTTLAIEWATRLWSAINAVKVPTGYDDDQVGKTTYFAATARTETLLDTFEQTLADLQEKFGRWHVSWGEINRFQRVNGDIEQQYSDSLPSLPVAYASSMWGTLPSYTGRYFPGTKKRYGVNGNSFVCAVEFGEKIKAKSLLAGGQSGDPTSPHFFDQGVMYAKGQFKDVLFYRDEVDKNAVRTYRPGE